MFRLIILFTCLSLFSWGQSFDLNRRKGGTYFFSQYFDQYQRPLHGTYTNFEDSVVVTRSFDYGILTKETREKSGFTSHLYIRENPQSPVASYRIWHNPKQLNEFWQFTLDKDNHLRIEISVFQENGFPLIHQNFYPLTAAEHTSYHGIPEKEEKIDPLGYTNTWLPAGTYEEWNEKGILTLRKEYQDTVINIPEEQRRKGKYIENYADGSVKILGQYDEYGHPIDDWLSFHENGNIAKTITYEYPNPYYLTERLVEFNDNTIKTHEIILDGKGGGMETRWNDNGRLSHERCIQNFNWDNKTSWEKWYYENGQLQRAINLQHPKDTVESKFYSNGNEWYIHLEKENISYQTEYYFNHNKKWEMIQNRTEQKGKYTEWTDQGDTIKKETSWANDRYIQEFENGVPKRKYTRNQNGINGDFLERIQDVWIVHPYNNGIRTIETLPIAMSYPDAEPDFKKIKHPYLKDHALNLPIKQQMELDNEDKIFMVSHYNRFNVLLNSHELKIEDLQVSMGRGEQWTIFEIKTFIGNSIHIVFYDNDYYEFLNRTSDWSAIPKWQEDASFKWN
jgi:hypothetical protein